jgi:peptidoglycan/xylan/chitin deacetylase (PgdA/CDA1 family)
MRISKAIAKTALHKLGGVDAFRFINRSKLRILMYHRFQDSAPGLKQQCEIIRRLYNPVSLRAIVEYLHGGDPLPPHAVAITVDDGYRDFLEAHSIFHKYEIPTTMFLVTDFLDSKLWLWFDRLKYAFQHTNRKSLSVQIGTETQLTFSLANFEEQRTARQKLSEQLKTIENSRRVDICEGIVKALEVEMPSIPPAEFAPLRWDEVRTLTREAVEFGAHTKSHPILSRIDNPQALREEIQGSKERLEAELNQPQIHFCYPNGRLIDFNDAALKVIEDCGFQSGVTTERGMNSQGANRFLLRRLGVEPTIPVQYFQELLAGLRAE